MRIKRVFTKKGQPYQGMVFEKRVSEIRHVGGQGTNNMEITVPKEWSQVATDIIAQKYCRKTGVPQVDGQGNLLKDEKGNLITGPETDARQVFHRLSSCWRQWGEEYKYFDRPEDAQAFEDELAYMLAHQMAAPNSPQWFNTGLYSAYHITGRPHRFVWFLACS